MILKIEYEGGSGDNHRKWTMDLTARSGRDDQEVSSQDIAILTAHLSDLMIGLHPGDFFQITPALAELGVAA